MYIGHTYGMYFDVNVYKTYKNFIPPRRFLSFKMHYFNYCLKANRFIFGLKAHHQSDASEFQKKMMNK